MSRIAARGKVEGKEYYCEHLTRATYGTQQSRRRGQGREDDLILGISHFQNAERTGTKEEIAPKSNINRIIFEWLFVWGICLVCVYDDSIPLGAGVCCAGVRRLPTS
jgi:hypothetical protein